MLNKKFKCIMAMLLGSVALVFSLVGCTTSPEGEISTGYLPEPTDTIRWFNGSYAILTELNGNDYNIFGGMLPTEENKEMMLRLLDKWWGVTDKVSADETLDWIMNEGHRTGFASYMKQLDELNLFENYLQADFLASSYNDYITYGASAIDGWDYSRALSLLGWYYIVGYYTEEEALDKSLEIGLLIQSKFSSWDDLINGYLMGYSYWAEKSSDERRALYEEIKTREDSPYILDFNMTLEKSW